MVGDEPPALGRLTLDIGLTGLALGSSSELNARSTLASLATNNQKLYRARPSNKTANEQPGGALATSGQASVRRSAGRSLSLERNSLINSGTRRARPVGSGADADRQPMSLSAHCLLPRRFPRRALCFAGPLRTAPAPNATGPAVMF